MAVWALVTGASGGLGREFAILAAKAGFDVILTGRQEEKLHRLAHELTRAYRIEVAVIPADLSDPAEVERLWTAAVRGRKIGVFINNAGLGRNSAFCDPEGWPREAESVSVNVVASTILLKAAATHMAKNGSGHILNVASLGGFMAGPNMAVYHATKAYLLSLSDALGTELKGRGVRVTTLCPGMIDTGFFAADNCERAMILNRILPLSRADTVAQAGWSGMEKGRRIVVPGLLCKLAVFLTHILPRRLITPVTGMLLRRRW